MASREELVFVERHDGWTEVILNRPHRKNALTGPLLEELTTAINSLAADEDVTAIVLRGAGGAFTSGHDLKELQSEPRPAWAPALAQIFRETNIALFNFPKPIVGALELCAINAGAALALSCDILVAGESAFLQVGEIQQGAPIANNAAWLRLRAGEAVASRVALYGSRVPAPELLRLGLAAEVVPDGQVVERSQAIAARFAGFPKGSPARIKADLRAQSRITDAREWFHIQENNVLLHAGKVL
ncbi:MAG: enoyl-CoA hydratase/isomerase family protein [Dehalococcoidia bacterium]